MEALTEGDVGDLPQVGKYQLTKKLGSGGMGSVWVANHLTLQTEVAVKFMAAALALDQSAAARFSRARASPCSARRHCAAIRSAASCSWSQSRVGTPPSSSTTR